MLLKCLQNIFRLLDLETTWFHLIFKLTFIRTMHGDLIDTSRCFSQFMLHKHGVSLIENHMLFWYRADLSDVW